MAAYLGYTLFLADQLFMTRVRKEEHKLRAWNKLPPPLRRVHSPDTFKRQLKKTFLYNHAFNLHC